MMGGKSFSDLLGVPIERSWAHSISERAREDAKEKRHGCPLPYRGQEWMSGAMIRGLVYKRYGARGKRGCMRSERG